MRPRPAVCQKCAAAAPHEGDHLCYQVRRIDDRQRQQRASMAPPRSPSELRAIGTQRKLERAAYDLHLISRAIEICCPFVCDAARPHIGVRRVASDLRDAAARRLRGPDFLHRQH